MNIRLITPCFFVTLLAAINGQSAPTDIRLADGSFAFQLPAGWISNPNNSQTAKNGMYIYGKVAKDGKGHTIIPSCSFILTKTTTTDIVKLYAQSMLKAPIKVERVFTFRDGLISLPNAIGVKGSLPISANVSRTVIVVYALHTPRQLFVEAACESPNELFLVMEADFRKILGSMRFY
ncbi:MAG TPA: hypothetical protein VGS07_08550 [Thermoanaerobaculia bacterium]|nr:hypothetical protein [Thermoanaerobaculia bacterium]